jgi:hypothetical protein
MTRAKSWVTQHKSCSIDSKFLWEEDEQKRVYIPEFSMLKSDLKYLNRLSERRRMTPSACLERMVDRHILQGWEFLECYTMDGKKRKRSTRSLASAKIKRRKYMMHPSILSIVDAARESHGEISYSLFFGMLISEYRRGFPLC